MYWSPTSPINIHIFLHFLAVAILIYLWFKKRKKRYVIARRIQKGFEGEKRAEAILHGFGFEIISSQKRSRLSMWVNGLQMDYDVRPDFFCRRDGNTYLVEVKTGNKAIDPTFTATRRQLLEYYYSFSVDGVLLLDVDAKQLHHIVFAQDTPVAGKTNNPTQWVRLLFAVVLGIILGRLFL